ncbi:glycosyltransferase family 4 protein [Proteiniphilum sp.]|uniref:glycosyltransferase family 4 protein n=1 Tax=Proteiniphilum sp. TaxID=1926877 RepID=UPI00332653FD
MRESNNKLTCSIAPSGKENKYMDLMRTAVRMLDIEPLPGKKRGSADYIWHHWIEKFDSLSVIKLLAATKKKIIWNVHNKIPHDIRNTQKAKKIMISMASIAHKIVIHCQESVEIIKDLCPNNPDILSKIVYVPHPNYIGIYGSEKSENHLRNDKLSLCFFGKIKAYKNIELLISAINELDFDDVELKIIGRCWDTKYFQDLIGENKHIKTNFRFIADEEIPEISANCHLFVFPYNLESSLNSGATLLAFSYGRSVISSLTGTLADIQDKSMFFSYTYNNPVEHKEALKQQIISIRDKYKGCYNDLLLLGGKCREYVAKNNSLEQVSKQLTLVFDSKEKAPKNIKTQFACLRLRLLFPWLKISSLFRKASHIFQHH